MLPDYKDILALGERAGLEPLWYDHNGTPRYQPFDRRMLGVYDAYAIYAVIECQSCLQQFNVGCGFQRYRFYPRPVMHKIEVLVDGFHYGDPPHHNGCVGETMNSYPVHIVEVWETDTRRTDLERRI